MSARGAQIHDIGYRSYDGPRHGEGAVARSLFVLGLRHAFGLGRPVKARLLPIGVLLCAVLPALVMVAVVAMFHVPELPISYDGYSSVVQMLSSIFVAAQAPVIFSRDLRYRTLTLYLARPLRRATYVFARLASLFTAILIVVGLPLLVLWVGAMLGGLDADLQTRHMLKALPGNLILTALLTIVGGGLASLATRRGIAIVAIIATLLTTSGIANALGAIIGSSTTGAGIDPSWPGVLNPYTLSQGLGAWWFGFSSSVPAPDSTTDGLVYLGALALWLVGGTALVLRRYAKAGAA